MTAMTDTRQLPRDAEAAVAAAAQHRRAGRLDEAAALCRDILAAAPDRADAGNLLGIVLNDQGAPEAALDCFRRVLAARPDHAEALYNMGAVLARQGRPDAAVESYRRALAVRPDDARTHNNLGYALHALDRLDEAVASYRRALAVRPDYARAHWNLGNALLLLRRRDEAIESFRRALAIEPDYAAAHWNLATALQAVGRMEAAMASFQRALAIEPSLAAPKLGFYSAAEAEATAAADPAPPRPARRPRRFADADRDPARPCVRQLCDPGFDLQRRFDVAVVMPTILRATLERAVVSVFRQAFAGSIQILIGVDGAAGDRRLLERIGAARPSNCVVTVVDLGYSTSARHGGLHPAGDGGAARTILSYAANSRHVAYLDDDNWWHPEHLASLRAAVQGLDWAFSLRWFVDKATSRPLCVDEWESVGPAAGTLRERWGGFVDPNCLMVDKLACEPALRLWSTPVPEDMIDRVWGMSADRNVCSHLVQHHSVGWTRRATTYYVLNPADPIFPERSARIQHRLTAGPRRASHDSEAS